MLEPCCREIVQTKLFTCEPLDTCSGRCVGKFLSVGPNVGNDVTCTFLGAARRGFVETALLGSETGKVEFPLGNKGHPSRAIIR